MKNKTNFSVIQIFLIVGLFGTIALSQDNQLKFKLENIHTTIEKPIGMFSIEDASGPVRHIINTEKELFFCDGEFSVINTMEIPHEAMIYLSEKHQYFIVKNSISEYSIKFTLIDYTGQKYWVKKVSLGRNTQNVEFVPMDNGTVFQVDGDSLFVTVYSKNGEVINREILFSDMKRNYSKSVCYDVSDNGEYLVILTERQKPIRSGIVMGRPPRHRSKEELDRLMEDKQLTERVDGEPTIFLFNNQGTLLRQTRVEQESPVRIFISDDGNLIMYLVEDIDKKEHEYSLSLIDSEFNKIFSKTTTIRPRAALFLENEIIISYTNEKIEFITALEKRSGKEIWTKKLDHRCSFLYEDSGNIFALLNKMRTYSSPEGNYWLLEFDRSGNIISQTDLGLINNNNIWSLQNIGKNIKGKYFIKGNRLNVIMKY